MFDTHREEGSNIQTGPMHLVRRRGQVLLKPCVYLSGVTGVCVFHHELFTDQITPNSFPTLVKAATAFTRCALSWPADICTRIRANPLGTTGKKNPMT